MGDDAEITLGAAGLNRPEIYDGVDAIPDWPRSNPEGDAAADRHGFGIGLFERAVIRTEIDRPGTGKRLIATLKEDRAGTICRGQGGVQHQPVLHGEGIEGGRGIDGDAIEGGAIDQNRGAVAGADTAADQVSVLT